jgi:hypothetical protein
MGLKRELSVEVNTLPCQCDSAQRLTSLGKSLGLRPPVGMTRRRNFRLTLTLKADNEFAPPIILIIRNVKSLDEHTFRAKLIFSILLRNEYSRAVD